MSGNSLDSSIEAPILDRFGDVGGLNLIGAGEISDGTSNFQNSTVPLICFGNVLLVFRIEPELSNNLFEWQLLFFLMPPCLI
jgi:hypothetical protein